MAASQAVKPKGKGRMSSSRSTRSGDGELQIIEIGDDDIGYDGDAEILLPDQYEEVDSESNEEEDHKSINLDSDNLEHQLSAGIQRLYCDSHQVETTNSPQIRTSRKRRSTEMTGGDLKVSNSGHKSDLEITEVLNGPENESPAKKLKGSTPRKFRLERLGPWSGHSSRSGSQSRIGILHESNSRRPHSTQQEDDAMVLG